MPFNVPLPAVVDNYFKVTERGSTLFTEFRAAGATFLTMCYILAVNSRLLSENGGPCQCSEATRADFACRFYDKQYNQCVEDYRRELITTTAVSAFVGCTLMGTMANLPFALAPGMGLNAYFTYDVVGFRGTGCIPWKTAMAAVFIEGLIFLALTVTGLRIKFAKCIPFSIKVATTGGIGMFLAHLGLQTAEGIGLVVTDVATGVTLGACPAANRSYAVYGPQAYLPPCKEDLTLVLDKKGNMVPKNICPSIAGGITADGICTLFIIAILLKKRIPGAIIIGVMFATFISWIPNTRVSYWSDDVYALGGGGGKGGGAYRWEYFTKVVKLEPINMAGVGGGSFSFDWAKASSGGQLALAIFTLLYVDLIDTTGTLFAMAKFANLLQPNGDFPGSTMAFSADALATSFGALMGTSPVTTYIESAPGIEEGGRTGLTAIFVGLMFVVSIFFAPLIANIPPWATGPALIVVGAMMMKGLTLIDWNDYSEAIPAFVTIILMPLTYSIAYGIIGGLFTWVCVNFLDLAICAATGSELPSWWRDWDKYQAGNGALGDINPSKNEPPPFLQPPYGYIVEPPPTTMTPIMMAPMQPFGSPAPVYIQPQEMYPGMQPPMGSPFGQPYPYGQPQTMGVA